MIYIYTNISSVPPDFEDSRLFHHAGPVSPIPSRIRSQIRLNAAVAARNEGSVRVLAAALAGVGVLDASSALAGRSSVTAVTNPSSAITRL